MDDAFLARFRERSTYEAGRDGPPDGFPKLPDLPLGRYTDPQFQALEDAAYALGFDHIAAGPLVRSSYHADQHVPQDRPGTGPLAASA